MSDSRPHPADAARDLSAQDIDDARRRPLPLAQLANLASTTAPISSTFSGMHDARQVSHAVQMVMDTLAARLGFSPEPAQSRQRTVLRLHSGARIGIEPLGETLLLHAVFPVASQLPRHLLAALQRVAATSRDRSSGRNRDASNATDAIHRPSSNWTIQVAAQTLQDAHAREDALIVMVRLHGSALHLDEAEAALRYLHGWQPHPMD
jgi:hypothetical protein